MKYIPYRGLAEELSVLREGIRNVNILLERRRESLKDRPDERPSSEWLEWCSGR